MTNVSIRLRTPAGTWQPRIRIGQWKLVRTNSGRQWKVWRDVNEHGWQISMRPTAIGALIAGWRNRHHDPRPY